MEPTLYDTMVSHDVRIIDTYEIEGALPDDEYHLGRTIKEEIVAWANERGDVDRYEVWQEDKFSECPTLNKFIEDNGLKYPLVVLIETM